MSEWTTVEADSMVAKVADDGRAIIEVGSPFTGECSSVTLSAIEMDQLTEAYREDRR